MSGRYFAFKKLWWNNNYTVSWNCENKDTCKCTLISARDGADHEVDKLHT